MSVVPIAGDTAGSHRFPSTPERSEGSLALIRLMLSRQDDLLGVVNEIATWGSAVDEFNRSIRALAGASWELDRHKPRAIRKLAVFQPSNNLLYAYVLFGLIPSFYSERVVMRPSARVSRVALAIHEVLAGATGPAGGGSIDVAASSQRDFTRACADADAVVFAGQYRNAQTVSASIDDCVFLALGRGRTQSSWAPRQTSTGRAGTWSPLVGTTRVRTALRRT